MNTKLAEELSRKHPALTGGSRLGVLAFEQLRKAHKNPVIAHDPFWDAVWADIDLLKAFLVAQVGLSDVRLKQAALEYLQDRRSDMVKRMDGGAGHGKCDVQLGVAPSPSNQLPGEGHRPVDAHPLRAQPRQPNEGGGGRKSNDTQNHFASPPSPNDSSEGHLRVDTQSAPALAAVAHMPVSKRGADAIASVQGIMAKHIVYRLQDGRDIMSVQFHELVKIERKGMAWARDAVVARYLREHCTYANPDPYGRIGDFYPQKTLDLAIEHADHAHV